MGHCASLSLRHCSVSRTENWMFSVIINSPMQSLFHTWNHCFSVQHLNFFCQLVGNLLDKDKMMKIQSRWNSMLQLNSDFLIPSGLNLTVGCILLSGCSGEMQSLNYLELPSCWAVFIRHDYIAEILEKVIYLQQSWVHNNSFVMRGLLLHFLFVIFTCNYLIFVK